MKQKIVGREKIAEKDLVSIIVPLFNTERFIGKCIESCIKQTYKNFELIIVDDGSADNSLSIAKSYAQKDARVKCYSAVAKGVSAARNQGVEIAKGDYLCFVDSDDYLSKYYIESLLTVMKHTGADIGVVGKKNMSEKQPDNFKGKFNPQNYKVHLYDRLSAMEILFSGKIMRMCCINKMYARHLFEGEDKIAFKEEFLHCEDVCFTYDAYFRSKKVAYLPLMYYGYTNRKGSAVRSKINPRKLTSLGAVRYTAEKCEKEFPEAYISVAGWQALVNIEMLYCMFHDKYYDYKVYKDIVETFKKKMRYVAKGKRHYLYRRMFASLGAYLLKVAYKQRFKKEIRREESSAIDGDTAIENE